MNLNRQEFHRLTNKVTALFPLAVLCNNSCNDCWGIIMIRRIHEIYPRIDAAIKYMKWGRDFRKWRVGSGRCPSCSGRMFIAISPIPFMTRCLKCRANVTNVAMISLIRTHHERHGVRDLWEMSTYGPVLSYAERTFANVTKSEYFPGAAPGEMVGTVRNEDVQNLSFADASLDMVTSNQVFEHVPDDVQGYKECFRVLRPEGALLFTIPLYDAPETIQVAEVVRGGIVHLAEPEYHGSRAGGAKAALVFWKHSRHDIADRVAQAGFEVRLMDVMITSVQAQPQLVIYAVKPALH